MFGPTVAAPAVVVHGVAQARAALRIGRPVLLLSGLGAGWYGGVGWWRAMIAAAAGGECATAYCDVLDCGDAPGAAMAALREGQRQLILAPDCPAFAAVASAAGTMGATIWLVRPPALDLAEPAAARHLAHWLEAGTVPGDSGGRVG